MLFLLIALFAIMIIAGVLAMVVFYQLEMSDHDAAIRVKNNSFVYKNKL